PVGHNGHGATVDDDAALDEALGAVDEPDLADDELADDDDVDDVDDLGIEDDDLPSDAEEDAAPPPIDHRELDLADLHLLEGDVDPGVRMPSQEKEGVL